MEMQNNSADSNTQKPVRLRKKWKIVVLCALCAVLGTIVVLVIFFLPVLKLAASPDKIVIAEQKKSIAVLERLENRGDIKKLEISEAPDKTSNVSYYSADDSIKISSEYGDGQVKRVSGDIDASRINISTIEEGREMARIMLSPYLTDAEITAILLRYSPDILANIRGDDIDMSFDIGDNYYITVAGSASGTIGFNILAK